ncbi:hypothetical protein HA402_005883 [Bradysia odoriphaga]|nr:hypothetical protein HA402_005883 [Bradysia odoriphaga]
MSTPDWNGFQLSGYILPDIALENVLASVPIKEILKLRQVCQVWRDITLRRTFWKIVFERNGMDWDSVVPQHIKEREKSWIAFYVACKNRIFQRSIILNHSGHRKFLIV